MAKSLSQEMLASSSIDSPAKQSDKPSSLEVAEVDANETHAHLLRVPIEVRLQIYRRLGLTQQCLDVVRIYGDRLRMRSDILTPTLTHVCSILRTEILLCTRHLFSFDTIYTAIRFAIEVEPLIVSQVTHFHVHRKMPAWVTRGSTSSTSDKSLLYRNDLELLGTLYPNLKVFAVCKAECLEPDGGWESLFESRKQDSGSRTRLSYAFSSWVELSKEQTWKASLEQDFGEQIVFTYERLQSGRTLSENTLAEGNACVRQLLEPSMANDSSLWKSRTDQGREERTRLLIAAGLPTYLALL